MERLQIGHIRVDALTFDGALDAIEKLVDQKRGGAIFTPNVDHVVQAEHDERFRAAYARANLCLADGMPLLWAARLLGRPLPEKVSGSDLFRPLMQRAARRGWRVYLLGGGDEATAMAACKKLKRMGVRVVGSDASWVSDPTDATACAALMHRVQQAQPDLVVVAMGAPKQELLIHTARPAFGSAVAIGLGATLDFFTGKVRRAPKWMSERGLEWLYRLMQEPTRLWKRYLLRDPAFFKIVARSYMARQRPSLPANTPRRAA